jgi:hypothetical protein
MIEFVIYKIIFQWAVGILLILGIHACGPAYPIDSEKKDLPGQEVPPMTATVADLGIDFFRIQYSVFHFRNGGYPTPQDWASGYRDFSDYGATYGQYEVTFSRVIQLLDLNSLDPIKQEEVYLVWSDQFQKQAVFNVVAEHHILGANNQWIGDFDSYPVWHDLKRKKWVLPISRLFQESKTIYKKNINESDTQQIILQLTLADFTKVAISLKFRVSGPIPKY